MSDSAESGCLKAFLIIVMLLIGLAGLVASACGVMFLGANGIGLIGLIPGLLLIALCVFGLRGITKQYAPKPPYTPQSADESTEPQPSSDKDQPEE